MSRARQVANFDPALLAADEVSGDKIHGGTISGSPTLVTPNIGTPNAGVVTNLSGTLATGVQDNITRLGTVTVGTLGGTSIVNTSGAITGGSFNGTEIVSPATSNLGVGINALDAITGGDYNVALGDEAFTAVTSGDQNTAVGYGAGSTLVDNSNNTLIGYGSNVSASDGQYQIVLGSASCISIGSYNITLGHGSGSDRISNSPFGDAVWARYSDVRSKKEIITNSDCGLGFINDLRTVTYKWKAPSELAESMSEYDPEITTAIYDKKMYGFIAQEVKLALDAHSITDFAGWDQLDDGVDNMQRISYEMFVMPLVKAVQELSAKVTALENA